MKQRPRILMFMKYYYSTDLHRGLAQYAHEADWILNTAMYRSGVFPHRRWNGVVGCFQHGDPFINDFVRPQELPAVSLTECDELPCVLPDNRAIGTIGADHLLELGYRNFAFYFWQSKAHETLRAEAMRARLNPKIHRFFRINYTATPRTRFQKPESRIRVLRDMLHRLPKPVAILAPFDDFATEIIDLCADMGLNVPKDVGVLGVNNDKLICDFAHTPISSIDNDEYQIGFEGGRLLHKLMNGEKPPHHPVMIRPKHVEVRKSTDLLDITEVPDRYVTAAARFIAEHYMESIQASDVAVAAGLSKRRLQTRFLHHMGRSIHEQITNKRVERALQLLKNTDLKTGVIASECGFGSRERFSKTIKKATGRNPAEYRQQPAEIPTGADNRLASS